MSETKVPLQLNLEQLRCTFCNEYLSCAPIYVSQEGEKICGRCPWHVTEDCHREITLENILSNMEFPCKFKNFGCLATWTFDSEADHESHCSFKPFLCTFWKDSKCSWKNPIDKFSDHFTEAHSSLVFNDDKFYIKVDSDAQDKRVISMGGVFFFFNYVYNCKMGTFRYSLAHFMLNVVNPFCKLQFASNSDPDCMIQLKGGECVSYGSICESTYEFVVNLKNFWTPLQSPDALWVTLIVDPPVQRVVANLEIDYDILNANKCFCCKYFLTLPIFTSTSNYKDICYFCSKRDCYITCCTTVSPESAKSLLLSKQNYPCRWINCDTIIKGGEIAAHEVSCNFRMYRCMFDDCIELFCYDSAKKHYTSYHLLAVAQKMSQTLISFKNINDKYYQCMIADNEIVLSTCSVQMYNAQKKSLIVSTKTTLYDEKKVTILVHFNHSHCKVETTKYVGQCGMRMTIPFSDFPTCFVENEDLRMTTTIKFAE